MEGVSTSLSTSPEAEDSQCNLALPFSPPGASAAQYVTNFCVPGHRFISDMEAMTKGLADSIQVLLKSKLVGGARDGSRRPSS